MYSTVFNERIKAVTLTCGFGSMRIDVHGYQTEGINRYSHLRPTIPRPELIWANRNEFCTIFTKIAPRPVHILAQNLDQNWFLEDVVIRCGEAVRILAKRIILSWKAPTISIAFPQNIRK